MNNIKLFEKFVAEEEDSNIYGTEGMTPDSAESGKDLELKKEIVKTWVNDYVIPMMDFNQDYKNWDSAEKDPKFKAFVSKAKAWLRKSSGIPMRSSSDGTIIGTVTNSNIVNTKLYNSKDVATHPSNKKDYPIMASFYEDIL
jgi:hypothetical protein